MFRRIDLVKKFYIAIQHGNAKTARQIIESKQWRNHKINILHALAGIPSPLSERMLRVLLEWQDTPRSLDTDPAIERLESCLNQQRRDKYRNTPLHILIINEDWSRVITLIELAIKRKIPIRQIPDANGRNIGNMAAALLNWPLAKKIFTLLEHDVKTQDNFGRTPLHYACIYGAPLNFILFLINHGANILCQDTKNKTPLDYLALQAANKTEIRDLLESMSISPIRAENAQSNVVEDKYKQLLQIIELPSDLAKIIQIVQSTLPGTNSVPEIIKKVKQHIGMLGTSIAQQMRLKIKQTLKLPAKLLKVSANLQDAQPLAEKLRAYNYWFVDSTHTLATQKPHKISIADREEIVNYIEGLSPRSILEAVMENRLERASNSRLITLQLIIKDLVMIEPPLLTRLLTLKTSENLKTLQLQLSDQEAVRELVQSLTELYGETTTYCNIVDVSSVEDDKTFIELNLDWLTIAIVAHRQEQSVSLEMT